MDDFWASQFETRLSLGLESVGVLVPFKTKLQFERSFTEFCYAYLESFQFDLYTA